MKLFARNLSHDPNRIRNALNQLVSGLREELKYDLEAVITYGKGGAADRSAMDPGTVNVLIVVADVNVDILERMRVPLKQVESTISFACMVVTRSDIASSCDVFPIKFSNMQQHYELLWGEDVLADLEISDKHLRLRCEQEVKNLLLRLRVMYLHRASRPALMRETLVHAVQSFLPDMQASLFVATGMVPDQEADLLAEFGLQFEVDMAVIGDIRKLSRDDAELSSAQLSQTYDRFMSLVRATAHKLDQLETCS